MGRTAIEPQALNATEVAALLGMSRAAFYSLQAQGKFGPAPVKIGRSKKYRRAEVLDWLNQGAPAAKLWSWKSRKIG